MTNTWLPLLMQNPYDGGSSGGGGAAVAIVALVELALCVLIIASLWKVFTKAGEPGWACLIPIYNGYIMCKIAGRPGWWVLLMMIPLVGIIIGLLVIIDLAKAFGKGAGFGIGLIFLPFIFYPMLGFGDATYGGSKA